MAEKTKNSVLPKLQAIMERVDRIKKDARNDFHKYKYASEKIIKETLHAELVKEKVLFQLNGIDLRVDVIKTAKGEDTNLTHIKFEYKFIDSETGDTLTGTFYGTGEDKGDKGTYQATTGAIKYILTSMFLIPTGDDPEKDKEPNNGKDPKKKTKAQTETEPKPGNGNSQTPIIKSQITQIRKLTKEQEYTENGLKFFLRHNYQVDSVEKLTFKDASAFTKLLLADEVPVKFDEQGKLIESQTQPSDEKVESEFQKKVGQEVADLRISSQDESSY